MRNDNNLQSKRTNKSLRYGWCKASLVLSCDRFNIYLIITLQVLQNSKCFTTLIVLLTKLQRGNLRYSTLTCIDRIAYVPMHKRSDKWRGQPLSPRILLWNIMTSFISHAWTIYKIGNHLVIYTLLLTVSISDSIGQLLCLLSSNWGYNHDDFRCIIEELRSIVIMGR